MESNLNSRQLQAMQTKNNILKAAMDLVKDIGFEKITISAICKKAGVSVGSFYYYFKSLDFIIIESYKSVDNYFEELDKNKKFNGSSKDKIISIIQEQIRYAENEGLEITTQFYKSQIKVGNEYFISMNRYLPKLILNTIEKGQEKFEIDNKISALEICNDILIISRGVIYDWCLKQGSFNAVERGSNIINRYLKSILI